MFRAFILSLFLFATPTLKAEPLTGHHNMVVFGKKTIYLSHLPFYQMKMHRFQGVYEVTFGEDHDAAYTKHKEGTKKPMYGITPSAQFRMDELKEGFSFPAKLVAGHPEDRGLRPFLDVKVTVKRLVHFHSFDDVTVRPKSLTYFSVGKKDSDELFLVHWLTTPTVAPKKEDQFDHIVRVSAKDKAGKAITLPKKSWVVFPDREDTFKGRIGRPDEDVEAYKGIVQSERGSTAVDLNVTQEVRIHTEGDVTVRP